MLFCFRINGEKFVSTIVQYNIPWRKDPRFGLFQGWLYDSPEHTGIDARSPSDWLEGLCYSGGIVRRGERCVLSKYSALSSAVGGSATGGLHLEGIIQSDYWDGLIKHLPSGWCRFLLFLSEFLLCNSLKKKISHFCNLLKKYSTQMWKCVFIEHFHVLCCLGNFASRIGTSGLRKGQHTVNSEFRV